MANTILPLLRNGNQRNARNSRKRRPVQGSIARVASLLSSRFPLISLHAPRRGSKFRPRGADLVRSALESLAATKTRASRDSRETAVQASWHTADYDFTQSTADGYTFGHSSGPAHPAAARVPRYAPFYLPLGDHMMATPRNGDPIGQFPSRLRC